MRNISMALAIVFCTTGCPPRTPGSGPNGDTTAPPSDPGRPGSARPREPVVPAGHALFARVEGEGYRNDCTSDADCKVGGCSGEVCSAEEMVQTTCEIQEWPQRGASCGCVDSEPTRGRKECLWYRHPEEKPPGELPGQGTRCPDGKCQGGLTCVEYFGIAGPRGPKLTSCEIPCASGQAACPKDQACVTIADGPGQVCRPAPGVVDR